MAAPVTRSATKRQREEEQTAHPLPKKQLTEEDAKNFLLNVLTEVSRANALAQVKALEYAAKDVLIAKLKAENKTQKELIKMSTNAMAQVNATLTESKKGMENALAQLAARPGERKFEEKDRVRIEFRLQCLYFEKARGPWEAAVNKNARHVFAEKWRLQFRLSTNQALKFFDNGGDDFGWSSADGTRRLRFLGPYLTSTREHVMNITAGGWTMAELEDVASAFVATMNRCFRIETPGILEITDSPGPNATPYWMWPDVQSKIQFQAAYYDEASPKVDQTHSDFVLKSLPDGFCTGCARTYVQKNTQCQDCKMAWWCSSLCKHANGPAHEERDCKQRAKAKLELLKLSDFA